MSRPCAQNGKDGALPPAEVHYNQVQVHSRFFPELIVGIEFRLFMCVTDFGVPKKPLGFNEKGKLRDGWRTCHHQRQRKNGREQDHG